MDCPAVQKKAETVVERWPLWRGVPVLVGVTHTMG